MHDCNIVLSIYRKNKIVACVSLPWKFVELQGGSRQKLETLDFISVIFGTDALAIILIGIIT